MKFLDEIFDSIVFLVYEQLYIYSKKLDQLFK